MQCRSGLICPDLWPCVWSVLIYAAVCASQIKWSSLSDSLGWGKAGCWQVSGLGGRQIQTNIPGPCSQPPSQLETVSSPLPQLHTWDSLLINERFLQNPMIKTKDCRIVLRCWQSTLCHRPLLTPPCRGGKWGEVPEKSGVKSQWYQH